jgi:excinuclease ABC subunit A
MTTNPCPDCNGARLKKESLAVTVGGKNIDQVANMSIIKLKKFLKV